MKHAGKTISKKTLRQMTEYNASYFWKKLQEKLKGKSEENMSKNKNQVIVVPSTQKTKIKSNLKLPIKGQKNTSAYYLCMGDRCYGQNISKVAKECKSDAPALLAQRVKKVKALVKAAKVVGKFAQDLEKVLSN